MKCKMCDREIEDKCPDCEGVEMSHFERLNESILNASRNSKAELNEMRIKWERDNERTN